MLSGTATGGLGGRFVAAERSKSSRLEPLKAGVPKFSRRGSLDSNWESAFNSAVCASNRLQCEPEVTSSGRDEEAAGLQHSPVPQWLSSAVPDMPALSGQKGSISAVAALYALPNFALVEAVKTERPPAQSPVTRENRPLPDPKKREDFYANVGEAIRVLRAEIPTLFQKDLTYSIYRDDVVFRDPKNSFQGIKDYKTIFWSLRFHGKLFFKFLYVDVLRIWESPKNPTDAGTILKMRWSVHGVPRVPWDAEGIFDGISTFKLDSSGKIYEHEVNNVILRDPPKQGNPFLAGLNLIPLPQQQRVPCPGAWFSAKNQSEEMKGAQ